jgi:hypothetical protein
MQLPTLMLCPLQVMFAEPLGSRNRSTGDFSSDSQGGSGSGGYMPSPPEGTLQLLHSPQVGRGWRE